MSKPLVSVIIPCYNAEKFIEKSVRSILNQTYTNLEILIIDDASEDHSANIIEILAKEDDRIRFFKHSINKNIVFTLNELINISNGKYIARMDADDISLPDRIERQVAFLEANKDYHACGTNTLYIDDKDKVIRKNKFPATVKGTTFAIRFFNPLCHPAVLCRAYILKDNAYDTRYTYAEDYELWCRLIIEKGYKFCNIQQYLLKYRKSSTQIGSLRNKEQQLLMEDIYRRYSVVPSQYMDCHIETFLKKEMGTTNKMMKAYINYCYSDLHRTEKEVAAWVAGALMKVCLKRHFYLLFIKILVSDAGRRAFLNKWSR